MGRAGGNGELRLDHRVMVCRRGESRRRIHFSMTEKINITAAKERKTGQWVALYIGPSVEEAIEACRKADPGKFSQAVWWRKPPPFRRFSLG